MSNQSSYRKPDELLNDAKKVLEKDIQKPVEELLLEIYSQHEKVKDSWSAEFKLQPIMYKAEDLSTSVQKKSALTQYKLSKTVEQQTNTLIELAKNLNNYTIWLIILTCAVVFLSIILILQGFKVFNNFIKTPMSIEQEYKKTNFDNQRNANDSPKPVSLGNQIVSSPRDSLSPLIHRDTTRTKDKKKDNPQLP